MEFKALLKSNDPKFLTNLKGVLPQFFDSYSLKKSDIIELIVEDDESFLFSLKQLHHALFTDHGIESSILVIPFSHDVFNKYLDVSNKSVCLASDVFLVHKNDENVKNDLEIIKNYIGEGNIQTLLNYIDNNCNANVAAQMMFLHKNSLAYRLKQIVINTGFEYNDFNSLLFIKLNFLKN